MIEMGKWVFTILLLGLMALMVVSSSYSMGLESGLWRNDVYGSVLTIDFFLVWVIYLHFFVTNGNK